MTTNEATNEGEEEVPFTPEQIQWIDRLIASRATSTSVTSASGGLRNMGGALEMVPGGGTSASGTLMTAASQPGELEFPWLFPHLQIWHAVVCFGMPGDGHGLLRG